MSPVFPIYDRGEPPEERPGDGGQGSSQEDSQGEPNKTNQQDQEQDQQEREHPEDTYKTTKTSNTNNQTSKNVTMSRHNPYLSGPSIGDAMLRWDGDVMSIWKKLSPEEKLKKRKLWDHRQNILEHYEIPSHPTPPRNAELDVSLDNDQEILDELDQEVMDDLEHEEKQEREATNAKENKPKHDCEGLVCPFVTEDDDGDVRCMMQEQIDKRELMEHCINNSTLYQQLMNDINKDAPAIRAIQANIVARINPAARFLFQEDPKLVIRIAPVLMGQTIAMTTHRDLNEQSRTDVEWSGPGGKPGKIIRICVQKGNKCKATAKIFFEDKDDDDSADIDKSTQGQIAIFQEPNNQFLQFTEPNEPGIHRWEPSQLGTKARDYLRLIEGRIKNLKKDRSKQHQQ